MGVPLNVYNDYPLVKQPRRALSADLVLVSEQGVELALEFKYEPAHARKDILANKLPVVAWGPEGVAKDVERIHSFVENGDAKKACSYFIDEGGFFRGRKNVPAGAAWSAWGRNCHVLIATAGEPDRA